MQSNTEIQTKGVREEIAKVLDEAVADILIELDREIDLEFGFL
jgi:hypothetical protein